MFEIKIKNSVKDWPVEASSEKFDLYFSGDFNPLRIKKENFLHALELVQKLLLILLTVLGAAGLVFSLWTQMWLSRDFYFLLKPSVLNLSFWAGCLSATFLWAIFKQDTLNKQTLNLLQLNLSKTSRGKKPALDIYEMFNSQSKRIWNQTLKFAQKRNPALTPNNPTTYTCAATDLFLSLLQDRQVQTVFWRLGINPENIPNIFLNPLTSDQSSKNELGKIPFVALIESLKLHNKSIDPLMLLCALASVLPESHPIQSTFLKLNLSLKKLETVAAWIFQIKLLIEDLNLFKKLSRFKPDSDINTGLTALPTYYLNRFSSDLTRLAKHGALPIGIGRNEDLTEIFKLTNSGQTRLLIKGPVGSGRTTVINELAYKMATEQVPKIFSDCRLVKLEISSIVGNPDKAENALVNMVNEAQNSGNIILVLEDLALLAKSQGGSGLSLLEILVEILQNNTLPVIATATQEDYTDYLQTTANFNEVFTAYELQKLSPMGILLACAIRASLLEGKEHCFFKFQAIETAVELTDLYIKDVSQPQKAIAILVEAASKAKAEKHKLITEETIQKIISQKTHIPTQTFTQNEAAKLLNLENLLNTKIIGQKQAITAVSEGLRRARSGLNSTQRPLASFLFLGPTGVGKTEVAKSLTEIYFGDEKFLLRLDMSEFKGINALEKLLGNAQNKTDTPLIKHIKNYPFCLLLLDEFEKASPEILNIFLQVLEDGRLTTAKGELLDLTHALVIATSNAASREIQAALKLNLSYQQIKSKLFAETINTYFTPELLNRFDSVILFTPLNPDEIEKIAGLQLTILQTELLKKGMKVTFSREIVLDIAQNAFEPNFGARPIRRYIQDHLESFVAKLILQKQLKRGSQVTIGIKNDEYFLT